MNSPPALVYDTGYTTDVDDLPDNLYCGCTVDSNSNRDLTHLSPYRDLSQTGCIYYCKGLDYKFAGLQNGNECWCGNDAGSLGPATARCRVQKSCKLQDQAAACYNGEVSCACGSANVNNLFRTSTAHTCPEANLVTNYASASFNVAQNQNQSPDLAIDESTCGVFNDCTIAEVQGFPTNPSNPAWTLDLGFLATVKKVVYWNRTDSCCNERMVGVILELLDANQNTMSGSQRTLNSDEKQEFTFSGFVNVRYVRLRRVGQSPFAVAEVQVFS